jgi:hypothetical protein
LTQYSPHTSPLLTLSLPPPHSTNFFYHNTLLKSKDKNKAMQSVEQSVQQ